jgi:hypothetical protein
MASTSTHCVLPNTYSGGPRLQNKSQVAGGCDAARAKRRSKSFTRTGMICIATYLHPDFRDSIRLVQAQTGENLRETVTRALNTLFIEYNVPVVGEETCAQD